MKIDLDGRAALIAGAPGALTSAVADALARNGAKVVAIDVNGEPAAVDASGGESGPAVLVVVSAGAGGLPGNDAEFAGERAAIVRTVRHLAPRLGRIVVVFSSAGLVPVKGFAAFSADQAGLASLIRTLAMELGPALRVNGVAVGAYTSGDDGLRTERFLTHTALRRPAALDEIVSAVLFLADPDNSYMTGHTLNVDGGWAAGYARNF